MSKNPITEAELYDLCGKTLTAAGYRHITYSDEVQIPHPEGFWSRYTLMFEFELGLARWGKICNSTGYVWGFEYDPEELDASGLDQESERAILDEVSKGLQIVKDNGEVFDLVGIGYELHPDFEKWHHIMTEQLGFEDGGAWKFWHSYYSEHVTFQVCLFKRVPPKIDIPEKVDASFREAEAVAKDILRNIELINRTLQLPCPDEEEGE